MAGAKRELRASVVAREVAVLREVVEVALHDAVVVVGAQLFGKLGAAVLERVGSAHGELKDPLQKLSPRPLRDVERRAFARMAAELTHQTHLVQVAIAREQHDLLGLARLRLEQRAHDPTRVRPTIDGVAAEHEGRAG